MTHDPRERGKNAEEPANLPGKSKVAAGERLLRALRRKVYRRWKERQSTQSRKGRSYGKNATGEEKASNVNAN